MEDFMKLWRNLLAIILVLPIFFSNAIPALADGSINYGQSVGGSISSMDYEDRWTFTGTAGDVITVVMNTTDGNLDTYLKLLNPSGTQVTSDDDSGEGNNSLINAYSLPATGTYTIVATRYSGSSGSSSGEYSLSLSKQGTVSVGVGGGSISYDQTVSGSISNTDYGDRWTFSGTAGDVITIAMNTTNTTLDTFLRLLNSSGTQVTSDDDSGEGNNSLISAYSLTANGTYTIVATRYNESSGSGYGDYRLVLSRQGTTNIVAGSSALSYGQTLSGSITNTDFEDRWTFSGAAGDLVTINMTSGTVDSFLKLLGPAGAQLDDDDDGGGGQNSLIGLYLLPANGTYTIVATRYQGSSGSSTGNYQLSLAGNRGNQVVPPIGGTPEILQITNVACTATDTYMILSFDFSQSINYSYFKADITSSTTGTRISNIYPIVQPRTFERIAQTVFIELGETALDLTGVGTILDLMEIWNDEVEAARYMNVPSFSLSAYNTSGQPDLDFLLHATHSGSGRLSATIEWTRTANETISSANVPICP
jgi:hypothetical protein